VRGAIRPPLADALISQGLTKHGSALLVPNLELSSRRSLVLPPRPSLCFRAEGRPRHGNNADNSFAAADLAAATLRSDPSFSCHAPATVAPRDNSKVARDCVLDFLPASRSGRSRQSGTFPLIPGRYRMLRRRKKDRSSSTTHARTFPP